MAENDQVQNQKQEQQKDEPLTPLSALAISVAYEIQADGRVSSQQRGQLIALFGKLVEMDAITEGELHSLIHKAFNYTQDNTVESFLKKVTPMLTETQMLGIIINLYDAMQVDGHIKVGERSVIEKFQAAFSIREEVARGVREFLMLKNDTSIFTDMSHPLNNTLLDLGHMFSKK